MSNERSTVVFPSELGWMCAVWRGDKLNELTFGHPSPAAALAAARSAGTPGEPNRTQAELIRRLQRFTTHFDDDLRNIELDLEDYTRFQRQVVNRCRRIRIGATLSYGELAEAAGHPGAARAVGQVMATNRFPLIVPCHRVIGSGGSLGGYSARDGLNMKRKLLESESRSHSATVLTPSATASRSLSTAGR